MKPSRMTWPRRLVAGLSLGLWSVGCVYATGYAQGVGGGWLFSVLAVGIGGILVLAYRFFKTFTLYLLEQDFLLIRRGPWVQKWDLGQLEWTRESPGRGYLLLKFPQGQLKIPRRILGYGHLKDHLMVRTVPTSTPPPFHLSAARSPIVFFLAMEGLLAVFFFTVASAVAPGAGWSTLLAGVVALASLVLFRVLFMIPLRYHLEQEGIRVQYLIWSRYFPAAAALDLVEDLYHADGAPFHLVKLVFRKRNLVLDEFNLTEPLAPLLPWIRENYGPAARSTF